MKKIVRFRWLRAARIKRPRFHATQTLARLFGAALLPTTAARLFKAAALSCLGMMAMATATAATLLVSTGADSGAGSLRAQIASASPGDAINFAAGLSGQTITLTSGQIVINNNLTIDGSALVNGIQINGNGNSGIFRVNTNVIVLMNSLTLTNGKASNGGGILNDGTLTVNSCTLVGNQAGEGGGIYNENGVLTVNQSTLTRNSAYFGGGIMNGATATVNQCTVTENQAFGSGYGYAAGIVNYGTTLTLYDSIVASNQPATADQVVDYPGGTFTTTGNNFTAGNPMLAPLGNYGGPTPTMPPLPGSPVLDAGDDSATNLFATEQRGLKRFFGQHVDIGAAEAENAPAAPVAVTQPAYLPDLATAVLKGTVTANGATTTGYFQYGLTTNYGSVTAGTTVTAGGVPATATVAGLSLANVYHFRMVAYSAMGTTYGADLTAGGVATRTWTPLANAAPDAISLTLLLSDGTVMAEGTANHWYQLTPDSMGSYAHGTWTALASSAFNHHTGSSAVLQNGNVFVAGGENHNGTSVVEFYNPASNAWSVAINPVSFEIQDGNAMLLANGQVLLEPQGPYVEGTTYTFNPANNQLSPTAGKLLGGGIPEATWVKLANDKILVIDSGYYGQGTTTAEEYDPATGYWENAVTAGAVPDIWPDFGESLYSSEMGPAFLLANGKAVFFGGNGVTAIYDNGTWSQGPTVPEGLALEDAPGAMLNNGKILLAVSPSGNHNDPNDVNGISPTSYFEYDYTANGGTGSFIPVTAPGGGTTLAGNAGSRVLLDLPDGTVLLSEGSTTLYTYTPDGSPLASGKPAIQSVTINADGSLHLTGTLFNGISQGSSFGDDLQNDSNYPLVRFTDASGQVRYGRTFNWSRNSVQTGTAVVSTECTFPAGASPQDTIQVVVNGIASDPFVLAAMAPVQVTSASDSGAGSLRQAVAGAVAGGLITFAPGLSGQTITLTTGPIVLNRDVTIDASALAGGGQINGNASSRIFQVNSGVKVVLNSLTLTNGYQTGDNLGGAIKNSGILILNNCMLAGNSVDGSGAGGAIQNGGQLDLNGCTLAANIAPFGGAINNNATCTLENCTFYGNSATNGNGGAIDNAYATLSIRQCTFSGNSTGGGGGGIDNYLSQLNITNTIIAGNTGDGDVYNWSSSTINFGGSNIVQTLVNYGTALGTDTVLAANPLLLPLASYGGQTLTMPPQSGSPAINAGVNSAAEGLVIDQRGQPRVSGGIVDIGAVESISRTFAGAAPGQGLDLQGAFLYAVNIGGNGAPGLIGNANFTADSVPGVTTTTPGGTLNTINTWASPNFGTTTNGLRLAQVMNSIRWTGAPGIFTVNVGGLQAGTRYRLQLLFIETYDDRVFNVMVDGATIVPNFRLLDYGPMGTPIVIPYVFTATGTNALIELGGGAGGTDHNPMMSGFTLETLMPVISSVTKAGTSLISNITNGAPSGGWTLLTTTNLTAPVNWTTNRTGIFDAQGNLALTNGILSTEPGRYFMFRAP